MSNMFYCGVIEYDSGSHHMLDCCSLCRKPLSKSRDIFMYRGDTPFCSEDCRQEQIDVDHEKELRTNYEKKRSVSKGRGLKQKRQEEISC